MPGNTTYNRQARFWLPVSWSHTNFAAGQTSPLQMLITGLPFSLDEFSIARRLSLVTVGIEIDSVVTAGFIRLQISKNGAGMGVTVDIDSSTGLRQLVEIRPGVLVFDKGDRLGVQWGSNPGLLPDSAIDGVIFMEAEEV